MSTTRHIPANNLSTRQLSTLKNPWAGLASYQDPEEVLANGQEPLLFCGRDNESYDVAQLIDDNIFVTLYGKSGTGKTSLLNAGVFPRLRKEQYLPISIRLGMDAIGISFQECIEIKLRQAFEDRGNITTIDVVPLPADNQSLEYLWSLFARTRFADHDDRALFPVLVFDQFEEVFRDRRKDAEALLRQIHFMMDESHSLSDRVVDSQSYSYDFNFRFVVSIREDDLYRLEDSIDNCYLADMKRCRYRLRSLTAQGARDAILTPGEGLFLESDKEAIVTTLVGENGIARNKDDQSISTNVLSLVCSRIFVDFQKSGADHITHSLVESFVKGNPFERFYNEATRGFSDREKSYIEEHLVDSSGERRNSVLEKDLEKALSTEKVRLLLEGNNRILQRTSTSSDGSSSRIELIHDSFCEPLAAQKEKRERRRRLLWLTSAAAITLLCIGVTGFIFYQTNRIRNQEGTIAQYDEDLKLKNELLLKEKDSALYRALQLSKAFEKIDSQNNELELNLSQLKLEKKKVIEANKDIFYEKAYRMVKEGYAEEAWNLLLNILPDNLHSMSPEVEFLAREIYDSIAPHYHGLASIHYQEGHSNIKDKDVIFNTSYTKALPYTIQDESILILDGTHIDLPEKDYIPLFSINDPMTMLAVAYPLGNTVYLWDLKTHCFSAQLQHHSRVTNISFSNNNKYIIAQTIDETAHFWNTSTFREDFSHGAFSFGGAFFVGDILINWDNSLLYNQSPDISIWDAKTKKLLKDQFIHVDATLINSIDIDKSNTILLTCDNKYIHLWSMETGVKLWSYLLSQNEKNHTPAATYFAKFDKGNKGGIRVLKLYLEEPGYLSYLLKFTDINVMIHYCPVKVD